MHTNDPLLELVFGFLWILTLLLAPTLLVLSVKDLVTGAVDRWNNTETTSALIRQLWDLKKRRLSFAKAYALVACLVYINSLVASQNEGMVGAGFGLPSLTRTPAIMVLVFLASVILNEWATSYRLQRRFYGSSEHEAREIIDYIQRLDYDTSHGPPGGYRVLPNEVEETDESVLGHGLPMPGRG